MAMMDYGALVFKNGEFINKEEFFMNMKKSVGWEDWKDIRYDDCPRVECVMGDSYSPCTQCEDCHYNSETGQYTDCKDNTFTVRGHLKGNYFAYIGDEEFTVAFYKEMVVVAVNKEIVGDIFCNYEFSEVLDSDGCHSYIRHKSKTWNIGGHDIHVKEVSPSVFTATIYYKGDRYNVIYGYGIDPTPRVWNQVKVRYLGKRVSTKVDRLIEKFWTKKGK